MITVIDVENTITVREDKSQDFTPYNPNNYLVSVGYGLVVDNAYQRGGYLFFTHDELATNPEDKSRKFRKIQEVLDNTTLLVAANAKYDLTWLFECGWNYDGPVYCTQVAEYLLHRGVKGKPLSLAGISEARKVHLKQGELVQSYLDNGVGFNAIPMGIVREYGESDVQSCAEVYLSQIEEYNTERSKCLVPVRDMSMEFCRVLVDVERNGNCIDLAELENVEANYQKERADIRKRLEEIVYEVMGDRPISLTSNDDVSMVIYSRKVKDKNKWRETFNLGLDERGKPKQRPRLTPVEFSGVVREQTERVHKLRGRQCATCNGTGRTFKVKKNGEQYSRGNICVTCAGSGIVYDNLQPYAGFKLSPNGTEDTAIGGFKVDKETLSGLYFKAENSLAKEFIEKYMRLSKIDTYLDSFVAGIRRGTQQDGIIHPNLNQTIAATGRLSSSNPNFQNMPREKTFPIRKVVVSRWADIGGEIVEADYAGLEFVVAGELANDPVIKFMKTNSCFDKENRLPLSKKLKNFINTT